MLIYFTLFLSLEGGGTNVKLLIRTRLEMENKFIDRGEEQKSVLWGGQLLSEIKEIDPEYGHSKEQLTRKFLNLRTTHKRIKQTLW